MQIARPTNSYKKILQCHKEKAHEYSIPGLLLLEYLDQPT